MSRKGNPVDAEYNRNYYQEHKEELLKYRKKYYQEHKEDFAVWNKENPKRNKYGKTVVVSSALEINTNEKLEKIAEENGLTKSKMIKKIIEDYVNK